MFNIFSIENIDEKLIKRNKNFMYIFLYLYIN